MNEPASRCGGRCPWVRVAALAFGLVLGGCGEPNAESVASPGVSAVAPVAAQPFESAMPPAPNVAPPLVDRTVHSVPLADVVFDTFRGGYVRLSEATPGTIEALRDAISPIYRPRYGGILAGAWLADDDLVIGYQGRTATYAYPLKILNFHEIVNEFIDGVPVLISYCPLCGSGVVFDRRVDGKTLLFGNTSALYENDMVMYDHQTGSYWFQVGGEAIVGSLTGSRLSLLASVTTTWGQWRRAYPETRILHRDQGLKGAANYDRDPFARYPEMLNRRQFPFPINQERIGDDLRAGEVVITLRINGTEKVYAPRLFGRSVVNDTVGGMPVVVFAKSKESLGWAFNRQLDGRTLTFESSDHGIIDLETRSTWAIHGLATAGRLQGRRLEGLPSRRAFWFSVSIALPHAPVYGQEK